MKDGKTHEKQERSFHTINRVANAENDPATGNVTAISASACTVQNSTDPIKMNAIRSDAGPPVASAEPEPINNPVPESRMLMFGHVLS